MADAQSTSMGDPANENSQVRFLRSLITVFKDNRDLLPSLPEIFDSLLMANEEYILKKTASEVCEEKRYLTCNNGLSSVSDKLNQQPFFLTLENVFL